jgi:hypothetical protein
MGTNACSAQRAESFRHILLLPPPHSTPSLRSVAQGRLRLLATDASRPILRVSLGAGAAQLQASRNCPTQAKTGLEWATGQDDLNLDLDCQPDLRKPNRTTGGDENTKYCDTVCVFGRQSWHVKCVAQLTRQSSVLK